MSVQPVNTRQIDYKGRMNIAKFRGDKLVLVTSYALGDIHRKYLSICAEYDLEEYVDRMTQSTANPRTIKRWIYGKNSASCDFDEQGRMKIPKNLLKFINIPIADYQLPLPLNEFKEFDPKVVVIRPVYRGIKLFEVWNPKDWNKHKQESTKKI